MINCPNCGTENRDGSKFCNDCGHLLGKAAGVTCTMCGAQNPPGSEFCAECGARLVLLDAPADDIGMISDAATMPIAETVEDAGLPDWLDRLRSAAPEEDAGDIDDQPTVVPDTSPADDDRRPGDPFVVAESGEPADDWLSQLRRSAQIEEDEEPPAVEPFIPAPEEPTVVKAGAPAIQVDDDAGDLPDWLAELRTGLQAETAQDAIPEPDSQAIPEAEQRDTGGLAWLDQVVLGEVVPATPAEEDETPAMAGDEADDLPSSDGISEPTIIAPEVESAPIFSAESDTLPGEPKKWDSQELPSLDTVTEIPDWLREMGPLAGESETTGDLDDAADVAKIPFAGEELEPAILPDWLQPGAVEDAEQPGEVVIEDDAGGLAKANIPDWLVAMRPDSGTVQPAEYEIEASDLEEDGVLAGLHDVIPIELSMATPPDTTHLGGLLGVLPEENEGASRFADVVERIAPARAVPRAKKRRFSLLRLILALALLLIIAVPMVTDWHFFDSAPSPTLGSDIDVAWTMIDNLAPGNTVIVAYDFDPSTAGEMEPLADTLIDHLMQQKARIIAVSLLPAGPATAQRSLERVAELYSDYEQGYGRRYLNLGYLPGKEAALRSFLADPFGPERVDFATGKSASTLAGLSGLSTLDDVSLIIDLSSRVETARWWIEQIGSQIDTPILAGVSAAVDPQIRPYYESTPPQIAGLISGLAGAAEYEVLIAGQRVSAGEIEALRWATVFVLLVILAGIVVSPFVRRTNGGKSE